MVKIRFVEANGTEYRVDGEAGQSLMEVALLNDVAGIAADCGGACACATCHVYVDPEWRGKLPARDEQEEAMIELVIEARPESRLACQIRLTEALDGLSVGLPESQY